MNKVFAQNSECIDVPGPFGKAWCEGLEEGGGGVLAAIAQIFSKIIGVVTIAAGLYFLIQFLIAGFSWISSGGDPQKIAEARGRITNALIGLILVVGAIAIMKVVGIFFGIQFLDLPGFESDLTP
jgi:hypothetical protein